MYGMSEIDDRMLSKFKQIFLQKLDTFSMASADGHLFR